MMAKRFVSAKVWGLGVAARLGGGLLGPLQVAQEGQKPNQAQYFPQKNLISRFFSIFG
jgi:hypothetical protein